MYALGLPVEIGIECAQNHSGVFRSAQRVFEESASGLALELVCQGGLPQARFRNQARFHRRGRFLALWRHRVLVGGDAW